jgi:hypothetical protein
MSPDDQQLRRLVRWNRIWLGLFIVVVACLVGMSWLNRFVERDLLGLEVSWTEEGGIRLRSATDGPFVVTHLSKVARGEPEKSTALLSPPIVIVDSAGATLSKTEFSKLKWYGYLGEDHPSPVAGTPIIGFYYKPLVTKPSGSQ